MGGATELSLKDELRAYASALQNNRIADALIFVCGWRDANLMDTVLQENYEWMGNMLHLIACYPELTIAKIISDVLGDKAKSALCTHDEMGFTPLHRLKNNEINNFSLDVARIFLAAEGVNQYDLITARSTWNDETPLHEVVENGDSTIAELDLDVLGDFAESAIEIGTKYSESKTPKSLAKNDYYKNPCHELFEKLPQRERPWRQRLTKLLQSDEVDISELDNLLTKTRSDFTDEDGNTPIHLAMLNNCSAAVC